MGTRRLARRGGCRTLGCLGALVVAAMIAGVFLGAVTGLDALIDVLGRSPALRRAREPLLVAAAVAAVAWTGALAAIRVVRQPLTPGAGPAVSDLPPEPPAVANMLVNDWRVTRDAVPATLLDLAARGVVEIEGGAGGYVVRLRRGDHSPAPYEARILELLRHRAAGGVVPAEALTTGPAEHSRSWWQAFRREVAAEARARGLSDDLWSASALRVLGIAAVVPAGLLALGLFDAGPGVAALVVAAGVLSAAKAGGRQRHTAKGQQAAARWLGLRKYLRSGAFADLPPTAVVVWERYLSYAAALGVAGQAVRSIPMGADHDGRAWTAASGEWRQIRIRYPRYWPPGWGINPWGMLLGGLATAAVSAFLLLTFARIGWPIEFGENLPWGFGLFGLLFVTVASVIAAMSVVGAALALGDIGRSREVTGVVLRTRAFRGGNDSQPRCYVAVDDARSSVIRAYRVRPDVYRSAGLVEYRPATMSVTRNLGYVRWMRRVDEGGATSVA